MDALSDILHHIRLTGSVFCRAELTGPWSVCTTGADGSIFHVIVRGAGFVTTEDGQQREYRSGDLIVLPRGQAHVMSDGRENATVAAAVPIRNLSPQAGQGGIPTVRHGGSGPPTSIVCGVFRVADDSTSYLLPLLPGLLHVQGGRSNTARWLDQTLRMMAVEVDEASPGSDVMLDRLADILAVQVLRSVIADPPAEATGWLAALRDPVVARTLDSIHGDPARSWTADALAREVGMSRSVFFRRFSSLVGEPPSAYLTRWRMHMARIALSRETLGVAQVAERVGYASEAAFNRAFRRHTGMTPAAYRRQAQSGHLSAAAS